MHMVGKAKALVKEACILAIPDPKTGKVIWKETKDAVKKFYLSESVIREMAGMKGYISVIVDGK